MKIEVKLLENSKNIARYNGYEIFSDLPTHKNGNGHFPEPFDYFVASVALCAAHFVKQFCITRNIDYKNISLSTHYQKNEEGKPIFETIISLDSNFPSKYKEAIIAAAKGCSVKKTINSMPDFRVSLNSDSIQNDHFVK